MRYLTIKNYSKHQHYKDRRPPWIKLHVEVLDDYAFACLQDASKAHLMLLWVLASKLDNRIPYDLPFLSRKLGATSPIDVEELVLQGFIEVSQDDGKMLAPRKQSAMPETETETETETDSPLRSAAVRKVVKASGLDVLPKALCDAAYEAFVRRIGSVEYPRFRKALLPIYRAKTADHPTAEQLVSGVEAFAEAREASDPKWLGSYTVEKFAQSLHTYVRLGGMPHVDEWGEPTERGRMGGVLT